MKKRNMLMCGLLMFAMGTAAQTEVTPFVPGTTVEGVSYFLPKTALRFVVVAEKQVFTPGEFCRYADMYLRLKDVDNEPRTTWKIKSITMDSYGVPDPQKAYSIKLKKRTVAPLVDLSEEGLLLAINTEGSEEALPDLPKNVAPAARINPRDFMTQDILSAGSTAKIAELTAEEIYDIRDSRNALIRGEADNTPKDGAQLKLMLDQLGKQEEALTQMFKGFTETSTEVFSIELTPDTEIDKMILFRFSERLGVVNNDDLAGEPIYLSVKDLHTIPTIVTDEKSEKKKSKMEEGVIYNVPSRGAVKLYNNTKTFCEKEVQFAQFGTVEVLSNVLFDKKTTTQVTFHQSTGSIDQLSDNGSIE